MTNIFFRPFPIQGTLVFLFGIIFGFFVGYYFACSLLHSNTVEVGELRHEVELMNEEFRNTFVRYEHLRDDIFFHECELEKINHKLNLPDKGDEKAPDAPIARPPQ